jgi:hypothetical protein
MMNISLRMKMNFEQILLSAQIYQTATYSLHIFQKFDPSTYKKNFIKGGLD